MAILQVRAIQGMEQRQGGRDLCDGWALRAGIGMTINLPGHLYGLQVIECDVYVETP